ncbi:RecB family exonuclease [Cellulomonas denverensis]|uniref:RecB family exonuclease n=1 Tax=Cellulomonas denverensis TaxID=264297 RepID=A0A7X6KTS2_9CELL|nr:RecB family exonuclease [Cellulomonas denverensis]
MVVPGESAAEAEESAGHEGARARVPGLSPSRANDFQQCPLLFRFRVVDRLPEPPSAAAARGTLVHSVLERLYDLPLGERTPAAAHDLIPEAWDRLLERQPEVTELFADDAAREEWLTSARLLLDTYFTLEDPNRLQPGERELNVRTQLADGPQLRGIVDRLDIAPDGRLRVVDYKTGKSPRAGYEGNALFQMRFYSYVLWRERGVLPTLLQLVYLGDGTVLRHAPSEAEMRTLEQRLRALWDRIEECARTGEWPTRTSKLCDWCAHRSICPAFGGTAPQVPPGAVELALGVVPAAS